MLAHPARLLHSSDNRDRSDAQPGDCVILNAANSTTGQCVIQLCKILRLRVVAIVRNPDDVGDWLRELGASVVISDKAAIKVGKGLCI